ncbi:MAG: lipid ABC transporter permease/ATP-binding protein, partial [Moritella sp.]|uniref:ABC transporter transmembrane domain-containing protein n=1 Tax=Moritella sp. TaxID=78556 RepID=UPI001DBEE09F
MSVYLNNKTVFMDQQRTAWQTVKRFLTYVLDLKTTLFLGVVAMLGYGMVDATLLNILQPLVDDGFNAETSEFLKWMPLFVVGMVCLRGLASFASSYCMAKVGNTVVMRLQRELFDHLMHLPVSFFDKTPSGELVSKIIYDSTQVSGAASKSMVNIFRSGAFILGLLIWMFYQSWQLSIVLLFIAPVVGIIVNVVSRRFRVISRRLQQAMGNVSSTAQQMLHGQKDVLMFAGHETERKRFGTVTNHIRQQQMKMATTRAASNALVQIVASFALGVVLYLASF